MKSFKVIEVEIIEGELDSDNDQQCFWKEAFVCPKH
jgi:hypothetical protein